MSISELKSSEDLNVVAVVGPNQDEWYRSAFEPEIANFPKHPAQDYESVFMEPADYQENSCGKKAGPIAIKIFGSIFKYTQTGFYYFLVFLLGFFLSFIWGLLFATVNYLIVWMMQPAIKIVFMYLRVCASLVRASVRSLVDPVFESWGQMFSFIKGRFGLALKSAKADSIVSTL